MIDGLGPRALGFAVAEYCRAYRAIGRHELRLRQIRLIGEVGAALDHYVQKPMLRAALKMMRRPAHLAGLGALQDFLERGFNAFAHMGGAAEFLATVESRETTIHEAIVHGADDPFPDPMAGVANHACFFVTVLLSCCVWISRSIAGRSGESSRPSLTSRRIDVRPTCM
jgi:hypothetical protein